MSISTQARFLQITDTASNWTSNNPVLGKGEIGYESDTRKAKVGDGATAWNSLGYISAAVASVTESDISDLGTLTTMNADTDVSGNGWVLDEDNMSSDLATKVPTQQSVKAYVDAVDETDILPDQSTHSGKYLTTNGTASSWATISGGGDMLAANNLSDVASASTSRTNLGVDAAGTDNSTDVTLAGTPDYITIAGQTITRNQIDLTTDVTGDLPVAEGGTGASNASAALSNLGGIGAATTDTLTNKTIAAGSNTVTLFTEAHASSHTLSAAECYGAVYYVTGAATLTLPAVASGMSLTVCTIGAIAVSVDPNASDKIWLDGTALDDGDKITNLSTAGDIAVLTYYSGDGWYAATNSWTDGGA